MAARVTATEVKQIISTSLADAIIEAFITSATLVVDENLGSDTTISEDLKKEIERWLSAHLISATRERQASSEEAGGAKIKYEGRTDMGLYATMYGQQVLALDPTGKMAAYTGAKKMATFTAITSFET